MKIARFVAAAFAAVAMSTIVGVSASAHADSTWGYSDPSAWTVSADSTWGYSVPSVAAAPTDSTWGY